MYRVIVPYLRYGTVGYGAIGLESILTVNDKAPSVMNGGLLNGWVEGMEYARSSQLCIHHMHNLTEKGLAEANLILHVYNHVYKLHSNHVLTPVKTSSECRYRSICPSTWWDFRSHTDAKQGLKESR